LGPQACRRFPALDRATDSIEVVRRLPDNRYPRQYFRTGFVAYFIPGVAVVVAAHNHARDQHARVQKPQCSALLC